MRHAHGSVERAILLAVVYSDLFDYPLTPRELRASLVRRAATPAEFEAGLGGLLEGPLALTEGLVTLRGREALVPLRARRQALCSARWPAARRFGRWLARVPFVRMVAVCGSQAVGNADEAGDIDFFCVTEPRRLWLAQVAIMLLRRAASLGGPHCCPNYFLTTSCLGLPERSLYAAHEVLQTVPLWGLEVHARFRRENAWVGDFLPCAAAAEDRVLARDLPRPRATALLERALGGRLGDALDAAVHRALLAYYAVRLRGRSRGEIRRDYSRGRQVVLGGGYAQAVAERFALRVRERLGDEVAASELAALFPEPPEGSPSRPDPRYRELLATSYGHAGE